MKLLLLAQIIILFSIRCLAQPDSNDTAESIQSKTRQIYGDAAMSFGTHFTTCLGINRIIDHNNMLSAEVILSTHKASDIPSDYTPGFLGSMPHQKLYTFGLCYGRVFYSRNPKERYILRGGITAGTLKTPDNFVNSDPAFSLAANYDYSYRTQFIAGILLNPVIECPLGKHLGFSLGGFANINNLNTVAGLEIGFLFGNLRDEIQGNDNNPE